MLNNTEILSVENLSVCYGGTQILDGISLNVSKGEIVGIVGESGSGKSTLLGAVARLLPQTARITSGRIVYEGTNLEALSNKEMRSLRSSSMAFLFQNAEKSMNPLFTIKHHFDEILKVHKDKIKKCEFKEIQKRALERVGLLDSERILQSLPSELSGGMCQRVALAFGVASTPDILLADEPTSALDKIAQEKVVSILQSLKTKESLSILIVSHDINLIGSLADRIIVMHDGKIVETGSSKEVIENPQQAYTQTLIDAIPCQKGPLVATKLGDNRAS